MGTRTARFCLIALAWLCSGPAIAHAVAHSAASQAAERLHTLPAGEDGFVEVELGFYVVNILSIDDASESFVGDFFFSLEWSDPRLVNEQQLGGTQVALREIWSPEFTIVNRKSVQTFMDEVAEISEDGRVYHRQRVVGEFTCDLDLREFPFDEQELAITMAILGREAQFVRLVPDPELASAMEDISPSGWEVEYIGSEIGSEYLAAQDRHMPRVDHRMQAVRLPNYYRLKVFLPLALIVFMAWTVFWIDPQELGPQIGLATSSVFTLIAFQLSLSNTLPRIAYTTKIDEFILGSTLLVFLALGEAIITGRMARKNRHDIALRIDRSARFVYPVLFVALATMTAIPSS